MKVKSRQGFIFPIVGEGTVDGRACWIFSGADGWRVGFKTDYELVPEECWESVSDECSVNYGIWSQKIGRICLLDSEAMVRDYRLRKVCECDEEWANIGVAFIVERNVQP